MTNGQLCPRYGRVSDFLRNDRAKAGFNPTHGTTRNPFSHSRGVVFPAAREEEERNGRRKEKEEEEEETSHFAKREARFRDNK